MKKAATGKHLSVIVNVEGVGRSNRRDSKVCSICSVIFFSFLALVFEHNGSPTLDMAQGNIFLWQAQTNTGMCDSTKSLVHYFLIHYESSESRLSHTVGVPLWKDQLNGSNRLLKKKKNFKSVFVNLTSIHTLGVYKTIFTEGCLLWSFWSYHMVFNDRWNFHQISFLVVHSWQSHHTVHLVNVPELSIILHDLCMSFQPTQTIST